MDQTEQIEVQTPAEPLDERAELIKAVQEAGGTQSVDVAAEAEAAGQEPPAPEPPPAGPTEDEKIAAVVKLREERHRKVREAEEAARDRIAAAEAERQRIIDEAKAEAERIRTQHLTDTKRQFEADPTGFLRNLSDDPQNVVDAVVRQGTPEARALQQAREEARLAREEAKEGKTAREELKAFKEQQEREKFEAHVAKVRSEFLASHASPEKAPYLHARYEPHEVFERCDALHRAWTKDGLQEGVDFDRDTLVAYLEKQSRDRYQNVPAARASSAGNTAQASAAVASPGIAKHPANGSRTPTAAQGSERRTSPKPFHELTADQQREELMKEVAAARRANPDASS